MTDPTSKSVTILMHRRLNNLSSGSGVHLMCLCACLFEAGFKVRIVAAPVTSFGRIPFCRPDRILDDNRIPVVWPGTIKIGGTYISSRVSVWLRAARRAFVSIANALRRLAGRERTAYPSDLSKTLRPDEAKELQRAANQFQADWVIAEYSSLAPVLDGCRAQKRGVLMHDLFSSRARSFEESHKQPDHLPISLEDEVERLSLADLCIHASQSEADEVASFLPNAQHIWMRPRLVKNTGNVDSPPHVVFMGVDHGGNRAALELILSEIWPRVWAETQAELWVVGEISKWVKGQQGGVRCLGFVEDLRTLGNGNSIGIAPMLVTSGISIKIGTYLELGMRVVTFNKTLEAYGDTLNGLVTAVDTPAEFSEAIIELLRTWCPSTHQATDPIALLTKKMTNEALLEALKAN